MIIMVDGYNLLKQMEPKKISESQREAFIRRLGTYAKNNKNQIIVVFDGGISRWATHEKQAGVEVVYAGIAATADEYIKDYVHKHPSRSIIVVSADRDLSRKVHHAGAITMEPQAFLQVINSVDLVLKHKGAESLIKTTHEQNQEIDMLMQGIEQMQSKEEEPAPQKPKRASKRLSKEERKLLQKVKKL